MPNNETRFITTDGKAHSGDDDWWEQTFAAYERDGVPTELITLARPLLDGNNKEQRFAHEFLMERQGTWHADATDLGRLTKVLSDRGHSIPADSHPSEDDLTKAWSEQFGPANDNKSGAFSLGTSKEAGGNALAQGGYPSGAGGHSAASGEKQKFNVAHFGD